MRTGLYKRAERIFDPRPEYDHAIGGGLLGAGLGGVIGWIAANAKHGGKAKAGQKALGILLGALGGAAAGGAAGWHIGSSIKGQAGGLHSLNERMWKQFAGLSDSLMNRDETFHEINSRLNAKVNNLDSKVDSAESRSLKLLAASQATADAVDSLNSEVGSLKSRSMDNAEAIGNLETKVEGIGRAIDESGFNGGPGI